MTEKSIFISHSSLDEEIALKIGCELETTFGKDSVWIDYFDLTGGKELVSEISQAIGKAKWFILIASESSMASSWVNHEAKLAIFRSIEKKDFQIITLKIDDCKFPSDIDLEIRSRKYIDGTKDINKAITEIIKPINSETSTRSSLNNVFVNRGEEIDALEQSIDQSKIIYLVGWHGIGKTSTVEEFANFRLGSPFIKIDITAGHDTNLLCRQIIAKTPTNQPHKNVEEEELISITFQAISKYYQETRGFIFFDDAELSMDDAGLFRSYLSKFIDKYQKYSDTKPTIIISTIQQPYLDISNSEGSRTIIIKALSDSFVSQCIQRWFFVFNRENLDSSIDLTSIVKAIGGHPLAAKLVASYIAFQPPELLNREKFLTSFRKNIAEYILRSFLDSLNELDSLILEVISVFESGLDVRFLSSLSIIIEKCKTNNPVDEIKESLGKLSQRLIIIQDGEKQILHSFINQFFFEKAKENSHIHRIAKEAGDQAYSIALRTIEELSKFEKDENKYTSRLFKQLNYQLMDYLVPAHRLLIISGQTIKAAQLPYTFQGHFREMVLISYQIFRDYPNVIKYADQWLQIDHNDLEIMFYKARAFRKMGNTKEAEIVLETLSQYPQDRIQAKVSRERGFISKDEEDLDTAIYHFRNAAHYRNSANNPLYPLVVAELAGTLIDRAKLRGDLDTKREKELLEAIGLLKSVKNFLSNFDKHHLPMYVDALMQLGNETEAKDLLQGALDLDPYEPRLNLRMATILRKDPLKLDEAYKYADFAARGGQSAGIIEMAIIKIDQLEYQGALEILESFNPHTQKEKMILKTIEARANTGLKKYSYAEHILTSLDYKNDYFSCAALIENSYKEAEDLFYSGKILESKEKLKLLKEYIDILRDNYPHHPVTYFVSNYDYLRNLICETK